MCVDAEGLLVGVFRQHTSRRLDSQLHTPRRGKRLLRPSPATGSTSLRLRARPASMVPGRCRASRVVQR
jgi:hypothetical protein